MTAALSRRDLLVQGVPALAIGATLLAGGTALAQQNVEGAAPAAGGAVAGMLAQLQKDGTYALPKLPYAYNALEPHIDAQTMELHHSKHHQAYVDNLNKAIAALAKVREEADIDAAKLAGLTRDVSFKAGGAIFHTIFFGTMAAPQQTTAVPKLEVSDAIAKQYGDLDKFKAHFSKVAAGVKGSGWAVAFYEPIADRILITDTGDQDNRIIPGAMPILLIDVWEHAYYLKYQNKRADYIKAWWNVVSWAEVDAVYKAARAKRA
jgi:Fe-Mn family superoxide dismutase